MENGLRRNNIIYLACLASQLDKLAVEFDNTTLVEPTARMFLDLFGRLFQSESGEYWGQRREHLKSDLSELNRRLGEVECQYSFGNWY